VPDSRAAQETARAGGASEGAISLFKLPLSNHLVKPDGSAVQRTDFYVPGSILRIEVDTSQPLARGMPQQTIAWAEDSPVFEVAYNDMRSEVPASDVTVIASYPRTRDPLLSGWLLGTNRIRNKAALLEVKIGQGRVILFGFRPQYRAQSWATYPLFFNALNR
jgi:hypothetical protein